MAALPIHIQFSPSLHQQQANYFTQLITNVLKVGAITRICLEAMTKLGGAKASKMNSGILLVAIFILPVIFDIFAMTNLVITTGYARNYGTHLSKHPNPHERACN